MRIDQSVLINAKPHEVFAILTTSEKFKTMTGGRETEISTEAGGAVSMFDGMILGRNVELVPDTRVVQAWRAANWPDGVYSIVRFDLEAEGDATRLTFCQVGHPEDATADLEQGWHNMYWNPMNAMVS